MATEKRMRRAPQQARGQRRVSKIRDAADQIFAETGYEDATTNAIAIRANTSIGSLYQFFPNKHAILNALANRYRTKFIEVLGEIFAHPSDDSLQIRLTRLIDEVAVYYAENPAFQPMLYASQSSKALTRVANDMGAILVTRVSAMFMSEVPTLELAQADFYATFVVYLMRSLIPLSQSEDEPHRERVLPQLKRMVFAYLGSLDTFSEQKFTLDE